MIVIPIPANFDTAGRDTGSSFEVTATVTMTADGLEVEAIDGIPVEADQSPEEEDGEYMDMDKGALMSAMEGGM